MHQNCQNHFGILSPLHVTHGVLKEDQVQGGVDFVVTVQGLQQSFVQAPPGLHGHVFGLSDARSEVAEHIHRPGFLQSLLHVLLERTI